MTTVTLRSVGLCAHFSPVGDRAFRYALGLARRYRLQLNVFDFLQSPFESHDAATDPAKLPAGERDRLLVRADRLLREYYEERLGDWLDVGFRVCEGREDVELRRCLMRKEYELLIIPYLERGGLFGTTPVEEFACHFMSPVVLVGRWRKVRYYLNQQAALLTDRLNLFRGTWRVLRPANTGCCLGG